MHTLPLAPVVANGGYVMQISPRMGRGDVDQGR